MNTYAGIDLHSTNSYVVVMDDDEKVLFSKRISNELDSFLKIFRPYQKSLRGIVIESTYNWYWLADGLQAKGYKLRLAMPSKIQQYSGIKYTDDKSDAHWLARLLKLNLVEQGHIMPPALRSQREMGRKRMQMVHQQTQTLLRLQSLLHRYYNIRLNGDKIKRLTRDDLIKCCIDENIQACATSLSRMLEWQIKLVSELEREILKRIKGCKKFNHLKTIPGVGNILGSVILLETGEIERFASAGHYASYCRCVGSERISNNKKKGENNSKNGNPYLCWAFVEAANHAIRKEGRIQKFYQRKLNKKLRVKAIKAVAHKLSRAVYYMLKDGEPFDVERAFK